VKVTPLTRFEWERVVLQVVMPPTTKLVALALAVYANKNGGNARPGNHRLASSLGISERTVERQLLWLREHGLLAQTFDGRRAGRRGLASVYQLGIAEDLPERVRFIGTTDTGDGSSAHEHPSPVSVVTAEHPTRVTVVSDGTPDTSDRTPVTGDGQSAETPDTGDAEHPTRVSPQQAPTKETHQQAVSSIGGPLRRALVANSIEGVG